MNTKNTASQPTYTRERVQQWRDDVAHAAADMVERAMPAFGDGDWSWLPKQIRQLAKSPVLRMNERAAFEKWAVSDDGGWLESALTRSPAGDEFDYIDGDVQAEWSAWSARALLDSKLRAPADQAASVAWTITKHCDLGTVYDASGERIATTYAADAQRFVDAHNVPQQSLAKDAESIDSKKFRTHLHVLLTEASFNESDEEVLAPFIKFVDDYVARAVLSRAGAQLSKLPRYVSDSYAGEDFLTEKSDGDCYKVADVEAIFVAAEGQVSAAAPADATEAAELQTLLMTEFACYRPTHPAGLMAWARIALLDNSPHRASEGQAQTSAATWTKFSDSLPPENSSLFWRDGKEYGVGYFLSEDRHSWYGEWLLAPVAAQSADKPARGDHV